MEPMLIKYQQPFALRSPGNHIILSVSVKWVALGTSYKWDHRVFIDSHLASLTEHVF